MKPSEEKYFLRSISIASIRLILVVFIAGCTGPAKDVREDIYKERPLVLTTFTVIADMAKNVAGDHLEIKSITNIGAEVHG